MTPWVQLGCRVFHIIVSKPKNDLTDIFCIWFLSSCFVNILLWGKILFLSIFFFLKIIFFEKKLCLFFLLSLQLCWIKLSGKYLLPDYRGVNAIDLLTFFVIVLRLNKNQKLLLLQLRSANYRVLYYFIVLGLPQHIWQYLVEQFLASCKNLSYVS